MTAFIVIAIMIAFVAILSAITVVMARENKQHIKDVATGKIQPDAWFWLLLDDPEYLEYYAFCLGISAIEPRDNETNSPPLTDKTSSAGGDASADIFE